MPALTPEERARRAQAGLKKARAQDKLDAAELGNLISAAAEMDAVALRQVQRILMANKTDDRMRIRCAELIDTISKNILRACEAALKLGVKPAPEPEPEPEKPVEPDFSTPEPENTPEVVA
jgi:hypothetical protein